MERKEVAPPKIPRGRTFLMGDFALKDSCSLEGYTGGGKKIFTNTKRGKGPQLRGKDSDKKEDRPLQPENFPPGGVLILRGGEGRKQLRQKKTGGNFRKGDVIFLRGNALISSSKRKLWESPGERRLEKKG